MTKDPRYAQIVLVCAHHCHFLSLKYLGPLALLLDLGSLIKQPTTKVCDLVVPNPQLIVRHAALLERSQGPLEIVTIPFDIYFNLGFFWRYREPFTPELLDCPAYSRVLSQMQAK